VIAAQEAYSIRNVERCNWQAACL